jgi:hypothetical protein
MTPDYTFLSPCVPALCREHRRPFHAQLRLWEHRGEGVSQGEAGLVECWEGWQRRRGGVSGVVNWRGEEEAVA